jgi:hypothetical protein
MTMELLVKLRSIGDQILHERPDLTLFAVVQPAGPIETWKVIVAAPWAVGNLSSAIAYVLDLLTDRLTKDERKLFFPLMILNPDDEAVYDIVSHTAPWKEGIGQLDRDRVIKNTPIRKGYVFFGNIESELEKELR